MTAPDPLYLITFPIDRAKFVAFASARGTIPPLGDLGYAFHQILTETFGAGAPKPFHLPGEHAIAYSPYHAEALRELALLQREHSPSWRLASEALGLAAMTARPMPGNWVSGRTYRFSVRTRPVCRIARHKERGLPRECDVFLRAVASKAENGWIGRQEVYSAWFREQIPGAAAALLSLRLSRLTRTQVYRKSAPRLEGPDVTFSGTLEITGPETFQGLLARGVGRHRSFGFGMLLLGGAPGDDPHDQGAVSAEGAPMLDNRIRRDLK